MKNIRNRYLVLTAATIVNFVHGNPYIWTVFQPYVKEEYGLTTAASSQPFTIIIGIFAVGNMLGGCLQHKMGARKTIFLGSFVMCAGFFLAATAPHSMPWLPAPCPGSSILATGLWGDWVPAAPSVC